MDKKTWIIIALSLVIIILIFIIFTGNNSTQAIIDQIQGQRDSLVRSNSIIEYELSKSLGENKELEENYIRLETEYTELESIFNTLTTGGKKTKDYLTEYGNINLSLAEFIQQNQSVE